MKRICVFTILLVFFCVCPAAEARSLGQNVVLVGIGCLGVALGVATIVVFSKLAMIWAVAAIAGGVVSCAYGLVDQYANYKANNYVKSDIEWEKDDFDMDAAVRDFEIRERASVQPPPKQSFWKNLKSLFIKSAEAAELPPEARPSVSEQKHPNEEPQSEPVARAEERIARQPKAEQTPKRGEESMGGKTSAEDSKVGVRGWCHCWDNEPPGYGSLRRVGNGNEAEDKPETTRGDYSYRFCTRCGKCFSRRTAGDGAEADIIDLRVWEENHDKAGSTISVREYVALLSKAEDKLLQIPDGQIVIPGACHCKHPDPIRPGFYEDESFYVCCFCGRVRLPGKDGDMPVGPTAWEAMMGPNTPFPGYGDEK